MFSHLSPKRGDQPDRGRLAWVSRLFSASATLPSSSVASGSFRFDRAHSHERLRAIEPDAVSYPVLRLPESIDPAEYSQQDAVLRELMEVGGQHRAAAALARCSQEPTQADEGLSSAEFLLFVAHVHRLALTDDAGKVNRTAGVGEARGRLRPRRW